MEAAQEALRHGRLDTHARTHLHIYTPSVLPILALVAGALASAAQVRFADRPRRVEKMAVPNSQPFSHLTCSLDVLPPRSGRGDHQQPGDSC